MPQPAQTNEPAPIKKPVKGQGVGEIVSDPYGKPAPKSD